MDREAPERSVLVVGLRFEVPVLCSIVGYYTGSLDIILYLRFYGDALGCRWIFRLN